jgi:hypothetical protein
MGAVAGASPAHYQAVEADVKNEHNHFENHICAYLLDDFMPLQVYMYTGR